MIVELTMSTSQFIASHNAQPDENAINTGGHVELATSSQIL